MNLKKHFFTVLITLNVGISYSQDMVTVLCDSYINAISSTAFMFRENGYPISMATDQIYSMNVDDSNMRVFLRKYVNTIFKDPIGAKKMLKDGTVLKMCVKETRGYWNVI